MDNISIFAAFGAGFVSFVSPCVLPMVPVIIAILVGSEVLDPKTSIRRMSVFFHSLSFVLGFTAVYTLMGALVGLAGIAINPQSILVQNISGSLLVIFGLFMLLSLKIPWLNFEKRLSPSFGRTSGYLRSFLIGGAFTFALTACLSPILGGVLTLAFNTETAWNGTFLLASYSLGLGLPFLIIGASFGFFIPILKRFHRYTRYVYIISGILLIVIGILILTNNLSWFYF